MTASEWLDLGVALVALAFAVSGWRRGAIASALSFLGVVLGAVAGILVAPHVLVHIHAGQMRTAAGIGLIIGLIIVGEMAGMVLGNAAREVMHSTVARGADSTVGALLQAIGVLIAAWLLAVPLAQSSQPQIAAAVSGSHVLRQVDQLAPQWLRLVPRDFARLLDTSGLPAVIGPFAATPNIPVAAPDPTILNGPVPAALERSVLRIHGVAPSCQRALEGTGFVVAPQRVVTNAHVVAGTTNVAVDSSRGTLKATVALFDPDIDIAVLDVPGLGAPTVGLAGETADTGDSAIILGYPGGGPYTAGAARVRKAFDLPGPNIYNDKTVDRQVYTVRGTVRAGNSGGPLVDTHGHVLGVVFGVDKTHPDTGYALTLSEVRSQVVSAPADITPVSTGPCVLG